MKIVHICLESPFIDGLGYQENIITKMHADLKYETIVITYNTSRNSQNDNITEYTNKNNVKVKIISRKKSYFSKFKLYAGLYKKLVECSPDIIFVHGGMFLSLGDVIRYCKKNKNISLYIDSHADFYNFPIDSFKKHFLCKYMYGFFMRKAAKYTKTYWGVTPWRCQYLKEVFGIPEGKVDLLVMGGDDDNIHLENKVEIRQKIRMELNISADDFVVITGGKIDRAKNIHLLMNAVKELQNEDIKLLIFGKPTDDFIEEFENIKNSNNIIYIGWMPAENVYDYFLASDLAVFPGTHSVLWEQACACGIPMIVKHWQGMQHVDVGGNCLFLHNNSSNEIKEIIFELYSNKNKYNDMKEVAVTKAINIFSYKTIAKKAIGV